MSVTVAGLWGFTDHCCRECLNRIMVRLDGPATRMVHRCSGCGAEGVGEVEVLCACGARYRDHAKVDTRHRGKNMGFRCVINPRRSDDTPAEIAVKYVRIQDSLPISQPALPLRYFQTGEL